MTTNPALLDQAVRFVKAGNYGEDRIKLMQAHPAEAELLDCSFCRIAFDNIRREYHRLAAERNAPEPASFLKRERVA